MNRYCFLTLLMMLGGATIKAQSPLDTINREIWSVFSQAYEDLDAELFASIHTKDLIRISGNSGKISDFETYMSGFGKTCVRRKENEESSNIQFRFLNRLVDGPLASEVGIYKLTVSKKDEGPKAYYGQFHVLHRRTAEGWKISMDFDFNPNDAFGEEEFLSALAIDEFKR